MSRNRQKEINISIAVLIVTVLTGLAAWLVVPEFRNLFIPTTPTPTNKSFTYQVRVEDQVTGEFIAKAKVTVEVVDGLVPLVEFTDSNGLATILIDSSLVGKLGFLIVEADGYGTETQNINLYEGRLPGKIRLIPSTPTPSENLTPVITTPITSSVLYGCKELSSLSLSEEPRPDPFGSRDVSPWIPTDDGDGYKMITTRTSATGNDIRVGPPLLHGCIEYRFMLADYEKVKHNDNDRVEEFGKIEFNFHLLQEDPEQSYVLAFIPFYDRAGLVYRKDDEWEDLKCGPAQVECRSIPLGLKTNKWYYVTVAVQVDTIIAFLQEEGKAQSLEALKANPLFSGSQDSRLKEKAGIFSFAVGPYATASIDNVKIWDVQ